MFVIIKLYTFLSFQTSCNLVAFENANIKETSERDDCGHLGKFSLPLGNLK